MKTMLSPQSLSILTDAYDHGGSTEKVSRNFHLRKEQDDMLAKLAEFHGETKVTILRAVIDEWRELKLRGCE